MAFGTDGQGMFPAHEEAGPQQGAEEGQGRSRRALREPMGELGLGGRVWPTATRWPLLSLS